MSGSRALDWDSGPMISLRGMSTTCRTSPSEWLTWSRLISRGGLFNRHGSGHEQFAWDIRSEPAVIDVFAGIWGTQELLVSFGEPPCDIGLTCADGVNVSLPYPAEELAGEHSKPWPHVDQSPLRRYKHCVQGIMNLVRLHVSSVRL